MRVKQGVIENLTFLKRRGFFPSLRSAMLAGVAVAGLLGMSASAQSAVFGDGAPAKKPAPKAKKSAPAPAADTTAAPAAETPAADGKTTDSNGAPVATAPSNSGFTRGKVKTDKGEKVVQSKDTKASLKKNTKADALVGVDAKLPDKQLYDKAVVAMNKGHYDVARLDLQTMLNTYPNSEYQMRAKLAVADSWYKEGGTAALTQAESEYADFRVFFPNAPEAAEAQMRIGDIYFKQMDKPDRDYVKALHAEEEYRRMLTDYPDSTLVPDAKTRLREVQEVLATRESAIGAFYATRENWAAVIARYQTVADTYPLYSHMDDTLIGLGDAFEAEARYVRALKLAEGPKAKLEKLYDDKAADCYRKVVLEHSAAPHVEDARDRLAMMNVDIPTPSKEQMANSEALENSRRAYTISDRATLFILHKPDTVAAARMGEPTMTDPKPTVAPAIVKQVTADFAGAFNPAVAGAAAAAPATTATAPAADAPAAAPAAPAAPLAFKEVGTEDAGSGATNLDTAAPATSGGGGSGMSVEILNNAARTPAAAAAATGAPTPGNGLTGVGPKDATPLPEAEKAAADPDRPNTITAETAPTQASRADGKKTKPTFDKSEESSSKHKKKKGIKKVLDPLPQ